MPQIIVRIRQERARLNPAVALSQKEIILAVRIARRIKLNKK